MGITNLSLGFSDNFDLFETTFTKLSTTLFCFMKYLHSFLLS